MRDILDFRVPFSGFASTTFINCFTSVCLFLEGAEFDGAEYECALRDGGACVQCGACKRTPAAVQERRFFLYDTVCGRSSLRCRFDGAPTEAQKRICETDFYDGGTEDNIDFLFGFAGYDYRKLTDPAAFLPAVHASIEAGRPTIAKLRAPEAGRFRVIVGVDGGRFVHPAYEAAQNPPRSDAQAADMEALYVVGEKVAPRHTFADGLRRAGMVMRQNLEADLWGGYMEKMGLYTADSLSAVDVSEKKARMKRVAETMWHTFNCHNFAEVFRERSPEALRDARLDAICERIGHACYGYTHDLAWALIALEQCADWTTFASGYFGEMVDLTLRQIQDNDKEALERLEQAIAILEG